MFGGFFRNLFFRSDKPNNNSQKKYQLGIALSGGGARGFSHLGSVKAMLDCGYKYDIISGTSAGAIVGCLLADGYYPDEILPMLTDKWLKKFVTTDFTLNNMMKLDGVRNFLKQTLRTVNIEDLPIPFIAAATDLSNGEAHYFRKGNIIRAVIASSSIPIIFPPVVINGKQFVDGGLINNLPVRPIREDCEKVIGLHVNPSTLGLHKGNVKGFIQIAERSFHLAMLGNVIPDRYLCDIFIEPELLETFNLFNFRKIKEIYEIGYNQTKEMLEKISSSQNIP